MIPRIHRRGSSFKGACGYVLHDPGKTSSERVAWVFTQNLYSEAEHAWFEMFDTYRNRSALKMNAGVDPRGRDNRTPVLHYTLSWAATDNPDPEHMKAMALDSLKALGLSEHEALIAAHSDKEHHHVHVVVNTVHPYSGKTAALKFSKLEFSRWAEAYEKEHGIHCEQRIENNERRREIAERRKAEREQAAFALLTGKEPPEPAPFEPVNDNAPNRRRWLERKDIVDKMKALRAALDQDHRQQRGETWAGQKRERDELDRKTHATLDQARDEVKEQFKGRWRDLYQSQRRESRHLSEVATHPFERAVFVFRNRMRLGNRGNPLRIGEMIPLILSRRKLTSRVLQIHDRERRALARDEKTIAKQQTVRVWQMHRAAFHALRDKQSGERAAEKAHQKIEQKDISFARAKDRLIREMDKLAAERQQARKGPWRQSDQAKKEPVRSKEDETPVRPVPRHIPDTPLPGKVPIAAQVSARKRDADSILMPESTQQPHRAPIAHTTPTETEAAKALLTRQQTVADGIPHVPEKAPVPARSPHKSKAVKADAKKDFREASSDKQPKPDTEQARKLRMQKDMENWLRRSARDDFERER